MKFNAFEKISPSINDTKRMLSPFSMKRCLKLGLISMLGGGIGRFNTPNIRVPSSFSKDYIAGNASVSETGAEGWKSVTGNAVATAKEAAGPYYYLILPLVLILFLLLLAINYITSVFTFVFVEALDTRKVEIKRGFHRNKSLGLSYFLFRIIYGLIMLVLMALIFLPLITSLATQGFTAFLENFWPAGFFAFIPSMILFVFLMIAAGIFMSLVYNFSVLHMYFKKQPVMRSIKATFGQAKKQVLEVIVFLLARMLISIIAGIAAFFLVIVLLMPFIAATLIVGGPFVALGFLTSWNILLIVLMVIIGLALIIFFAYIFNVFFLPLSVFARYFSIHNYKELMKR